MLNNERSRPDSGLGKSKIDTELTTPLMKPACEPDGPTLRFNELLKVTKVRKSKAYQLMKTDPTFPQGAPLYDGDQSPMIYRTEEAVAWVNSRFAKRRTKRGNWP